MLPLLTALATLAIASPGTDRFNRYIRYRADLEADDLTRAGAVELGGHVRVGPGLTAVDPVRVWAQSTIGAQVGVFLSHRDELLTWAGVQGTAPLIYGPRFELMGGYRYAAPDPNRRLYVEVRGGVVVHAMTGHTAQRAGLGTGVMLLGGRGYMSFGAAIEVEHEGRGAFSVAVPICFGAGGFFLRD